MTISPCLETLETARIATGEPEVFRVLDRFQVGGRDYLVVAEEAAVNQALEDEEIPPIFCFAASGGQLSPVPYERLAEAYRTLLEAPDPLHAPRQVTLQFDQDPEPFAFEEEDMITLDEDGAGKLVALFNVTDDRDVRVAYRSGEAQGQPVYSPCPEGMATEVARLARLMDLRRRLMRTVH